MIYHIFDGELLTANPCLPVLNTIKDPLPLQFLAACRVLVVLLQSTNHKRTFLLCQEFRRIREILDDPKRDRSRQDSGQTL